MTTKVNSLPTCPGCRRRHKCRAALLACIDRRLNPSLTNILLAPIGAAELGYKVGDLLRRLRRVVAAYPDGGAALPYRVTLAQTDWTRQGKYQLVCGYHRAFMGRAGLITASEKVT